MDAAQALGEARRQHNAIVNGVIHGSGALEEALEGLQSVRAALHGLGDDAAQLASLAALNQVTGGIMMCSNSLLCVCGIH